MLPIVDIERTKEEFIVALQSKMDWFSVYDLERFFLGQLAADDYDKIYDTLDNTLEDTEAYIEEVKVIYF